VDAGYVIDPLNHVEEYDQYSYTTDGTSTWPRVTHQEMDGGKNVMNLSYSVNGSSGNTTITDGLSHTTSYHFDNALQQLLSMSGYLCHCENRLVEYSYDNFGRLVSTGAGPYTERTFAYNRDPISRARTERRPTR